MCRFPFDAMDLLATFNELYRKDSALANLLANFQRIQEPMNLLDIALLCAFVFVILSQLAKSPVRRLLNGLLLILVLLSAVTAFQSLTALNWIIGNSFLVILVSIPIIFQYEIRDLLNEFGTGAAFWERLFRRGTGSGPSDLSFIDELISSVRYLQSKRLGALVVIPRQDRLATTLNEGTEVDALCVDSLLNLVFEKNSHIHDGAVILREGRIEKANVLFEVKDEAPNPNDRLSRNFGSRHMAAVAITRHTDALCVLVSEETGEVGLSFGGQLDKLDAEELQIELYQLLSHSGLSATAEQERG